MPTKTEHVLQAEHNHDFWNSFNLESTPYVDWIVTGIFYESVHWAEAFLSTRGEHSDNHGKRLLILHQFSSVIGGIIPDLETLKQESENARYRCYKHTSDEISTDLVPLCDNIKKQVKATFS